MALKDNDIAWFRPLWRRVAVTAFLGLWLAWELFWSRDTFWAILVAAGFAYSLYNFFYAFPKESPSKDQVPPPNPPEEDDAKG